MSSARKTQLYHRLQKAARTLQRGADAALIDATGITTAQAGVLAIVKQHGQIRQREVARELGLKEPAVTAMVSRLAGLGLLSRDQDPQDARAWSLTLSEEGIRRLAQLELSFRRLNARIEAVLGDSEILALADALDRLTREFSDDRLD